jgi:hypothetical protein
MLPEVLGDKSERSQHIRLGKALESRRDRIYGRFRILATKTHDDKGRRVPGYQFLPFDKDQKHRGHRDIGEIHVNQTLFVVGFPRCPDVPDFDPGSACPTNEAASAGGSRGKEEFEI